MRENTLSYKIRGAIFRVYNNLGPGLLESVYEAALVYELKKDGIPVETQVPVPVIYDSKKLELGFRLDLLVEKKVIVELKSIESIQKVHFKVLLTYLKLTNLKLGILVNFNSDNISKSIFRRVNNLRA
jgi:GxxExxY protein